MAAEPKRSMKAKGEEAIYCFGEFQLDLHRVELRRRGLALVLPAKSMDVLVYLVENRGRPVLRDELLAALWPNTRVANGSLRQAIWEIRKVLSEPSGSNRTIETLHGRGYCFNAQVTRFSSPNAVTDALMQRLHILPSDLRSLVLELAQQLALTDLC